MELDLDNLEEAERAFEAEAPREYSFEEQAKRWQYKTNPNKVEV